MPIKIPNCASEYAVRGWGNPCSIAHVLEHRCVGSARPHTVKSQRVYVMTMVGFMTPFFRSVHRNDDDCSYAMAYAQDVLEALDGTTWAVLGPAEIMPLGVKRLPNVIQDVRHLHALISAAMAVGVENICPGSITGPREWLELRRDALREWNRESIELGEAAFAEILTEQDDSGHACMTLRAKYAKRAAA